MENELVIKKDVHVGTIDHNFAELKKRAQQMVEPYVGQILTEDSVKDGKADLATLRKFRSGLDNERKNIKQQWMAPYNEFEAQAKQVIAVIDVPINELDSQVKAFEQKEIDQKLEDIDELKAKILEDHELADFIFSLDWFDNPKWKNKTYGMKKIEEDILQKVHNIENDLELIRSTCGEFTDPVIVEYKRLGNAASAIKLRNELERQKKVAEERNARLKQERTKANESKKGAGSNPVQEAPVQHYAAQAPSQDVQKKPEKKSFIFELTTTRDGLSSLLQFCRENGIGIRKVEA